MKDGPQRKTNHDALRAEMRTGDRARLREIRIQARSAAPMRHPDHLHAALAFGRLYREATNRRRGSRTRFEESLREELRAEGLEREHIQVQKLKLPATVMAIDDQVRRKWFRCKTPHRSLHHYLAAVRVVADMLGQDRESVQITFLRELPLWNNTPRLDVSEEARDAADALCRLLDRMGRSVAQETDLMTTVRRATCQSIGWHPLTGVVEAVSGHQMDGPFSPVHPTCDIGTHISEMRPFASVPLVQIPMGWIDCDLFVEEGENTAGAGFRAPRTVGEFRRRRGRLIQYREIRLALAPLDDRVAGCVLLSQDALAWRDESVLGFGQDMPVVGEGNWSDVSQTDHGGDMFHLEDQASPTHEIQMSDGWHRVTLQHGNSLHQARDDYKYDFGRHDWEWDPIERPGEILHLGCGYVSATRLTPDHVHLWLLQPQSLDDERVVCPWQSPWVEDRPTKVLRSPPFTPARQIEDALYDGRIEAALCDQALSISKQVTEILERSREAANAAEQALIARWSLTAPPASTSLSRS